jgi:hypothetical protein
MSEDDKKYIDPELEKFLKENKEMLERLFSEEKEMMEKFFKEGKSSFKETFNKECGKAEDFAKEKKDKAKEKAEDVFNAFTDPEVQKHFMVMGMEFMMGMSALIKAMPFPDFMKDAAGKAEEAGKSKSSEFSGSDSDKRNSKVRFEKIDIEMSPIEDDSESSENKEESD